MAGTDLLPRTPQEQDSAYNPADADYLLSPEHMAKEPEQYPDREKLNDAEKTPEAPAGDEINYNPSGDNKRQPLWSRLSKNKRVAVASLGALGGGGLILALFMGLLPLKLEALISNITDAASEVPGYAVEQRTEYLITRVLATRMLMMANGTSEDAGKVAFCKNSSISCSLFTTYTANYFEEMMDFDLSKTDSGMKLSVKANGRSRLGGSATNWEIQVSDKFDQKGIASTIKKIETNKEMRVFLKNRIDQKLSTKNVISRFVARKILMKKYGVTSWRAFEKTTNKVNDIKSSLRAATYKNTIGKISPRFASYLACFQGGTAACDKLLDQLSTDIGEPKKPVESDFPNDPDGYKEANDKYEKDLKQINSIRDLQSKLAGEIPSTPGTDIGKAVGKIFSSKVIGIVGAVATVDLVLVIVNSIDDNTPSLVHHNMAAQNYTGLAYGDGAGIVTNWEKAKAGDFTDSSGGEVINELSTLVDCDGSPLCAYESGYLSSADTVSAASNQVQRVCPTSDGFEMTTLEAGELLCPAYRLVVDYTKAFSGNPLWQSVATAAKVWVSTPAHFIIDLYNQAFSATFDAISSITGLDKLFSAVGDFAMTTFADGIEYVTKVLFDPPQVGYDVPTSLNYDALSGAIHTEQWELMQNGITSDGTVLGGGGQYLSDEEASSIVVYQNAQDKEEFNNQSLFARLFDPSLKGSLVQLAAVQMPTTLSGLAKLPGKTMAALFSLPSVNAANATQWQSFHLPQYGYKLNDPVLRADPSIYTEAYCTSTAEARADPSNKKKVGNSIIPVFVVSDPCALERLSVGSAITTANPTDKNAFKPLFNVNSTSSGGSCAPGTDLVGGITEGWDREGEKKTIVLCSIPETIMTGEALWKDERYKGTTALGVKNLSINSEGAAQLLEAAKMAKSTKGITLTASIGYRSLFEQCSIYIRDYEHPKECPDWVTKIDAGWSTTVIYSNHMMGLSLDFDETSENWMHTCMQSKSTTEYDTKDDNRCFGFWDDVNQGGGGDSAHYTYDP